MRKLSLFLPGNPRKDNLLASANEFSAQFNPFFFGPKLRLSTGIAEKENAAY